MLATIAKQFTFDAAHRLERLPPDHKCHRLHGHTYCVELVVCGPVDEIGFVVDYAELADWWRECFDQLDHRFLNDVPGIGESSTTEIIAAWIAVRVLRRINLFNAAHQSTGGGVSLERVVLHESSTTWCSVYAVNISEADRTKLLADTPDREILTFALSHGNMSPREIAAHFGVPKDRVHGILQRDLAEIVRTEGR